MMPYQPPSITFQGRLWPSAELARRARRWRSALRGTIDGVTTPLAMVFANRPEAVTLFFALSSFAAPLLILSPDPSEWASAPAVPAGTLLVLSPDAAPLTAAARRRGLRPFVVGEDAGASVDDAAFLTTPGVVLFTSGSTSLPRPVYRRMTGLLAAARAIVETVGVAPGTGVIAASPLAKALGFHQGLLVPVVNDSPVALLERFDPHTMLDLFASRRYGYWAGVPLMADLLIRAARRTPHPAPSRCLVLGMSAALARRFRDRFGLSPRQMYGATEMGMIAADGAPDAEVRPETVGRPIRGVEVRIGDDPRRPNSVGRPGRIWIRAPAYLMEGYGIPPEVEPPPLVDGWWGTPDVGALERAGRLTVAGRLDDCFRTDAGKLVSPGAVTAALDVVSGVTDAVAVPLVTVRGRVLGVLVECAEHLTPADLRRHLAAALAAWAQPAVLCATRALPRLPNGKTDRRACIDILTRAIEQD